MTTDLVVGGAKHTPAALTAVFRNASAAVDEADAGHKQWLDSVASMKTSVASANVVYKHLRSYLIGTYGTAEKTPLGDFGMSAPKPNTKKTASTKAAAAVKAVAMRSMRHTMGQNQKKLVKSNIKVRTAAVADAGTATPAPVATTAPVTPAPTTGAAPSPSGDDDDDDDDEAG